MWYAAKAVALLMPTSSTGYQLDILQTPGTPRSLLVRQVSPVPYLYVSICQVVTYIDIYTLPLFPSVTCVVRSLMTWVTVGGK